MRLSICQFDKIHPRLVGKKNTAGVGAVLELHRHGLAVHGKDGGSNATVPRPSVIIENAGAWLDLVNGALSFHAYSISDRSRIIILILILFPLFA